MSPNRMVSGSSVSMAWRPNRVAMRDGSIRTNIAASVSGERTVRKSSSRAAR